MKITPFLSPFFSNDACVNEVLLDT